MQQCGRQQGPAKAFGESRKSPTTRPAPRAAVCAAARPADRVLPTLGLGLAAGLAALHLVASPVLPAHADWDGSSSALGSCALGDAGDACRKRLIAKDTLGSYAGMSNNAAKLSGKATGVPVSELGGAYAADTAALGDSILAYAQMDVYDAARPQLVRDLKVQGQTWVSKYARGGNVRSTSARRFYVAVDSLGGHLASNGMAPYPKNKLAKLVTDVEQGRAALAEGK